MTIATSDRQILMPDSQSPPCEPFSIPFGSLKGVSISLPPDSLLESIFFIVSNRRNGHATRDSQQNELAFFCQGNGNHGAVSVIVVCAKHLSLH